MNNPLHKLPLDINFENKIILKAVISASRSLAELKGEAKTIPNEEILINTLFVQEAKDSSEIENIVTTHDDIFKSELDDKIKNSASKEVRDYIRAIKLGFDEVKEHGLLTNRAILNIQKCIQHNNAGFRKMPGTSLKDGKGNIVYEPPQDPKHIQELMTNLEAYINDDTLQDIDPLIKMAIVHFQFESIHPFYDGNGRTGRIINILYMVKNHLLDLPILYLSRYIIQNKENYYRLLNKLNNNTQNEEDWQEWILFMINGVEETARHTISTIKSIKSLMNEFEDELKTKTNFYSKDLLETLFVHPYVKISSFGDELEIHRHTASSYLAKLESLNLLSLKTYGKAKYYINDGLLDILKK